VATSLSGFCSALAIAPFVKPEALYRLVRAVTDSEHCITIPRHKNLRVGTLNSILQDVGEQLGLGKEEILAGLLA